MHARYHLFRPLLVALLGTGMFWLTVVSVSAQAVRPMTPVIPTHATVLKATPAIGSTIAQVPTQVIVFTAENINPDPSKSNLFVYGPSGEATGKLISQGNATVSLSDPKQMSITIKPNTSHLSGVYVVHWITVSADDNEADEGAFTFTVGSGTATPPAQQTVPANTSGSGGTPIWLTIVIGLAALLIGLVGGVAFSRRNSAAPATSLGALRKTIQEDQEESINRP